MHTIDKQQKIEILLGLIFEPSVMAKLLFKYVELTLAFHRKDAAIQTIVGSLQREAFDREFFTQFLDAFGQAFSEEEIDALIEIYRNPVMKKMLVEGKVLLDQIFMKVAGLVTDEVLKLE